MTDQHESEVEVEKIYNSHKIFMVMLATLLPCLFSTMHEYTPLSVRFNPLLNVKACADERSSLVSKRFQRYFGAKFSKETKIQAHKSGNVIKFMQKINQL
jgi:hypothetical protein